MKCTFKEVMDMLGVPKELGPYETWPWSHYEDESGESMSAEVRMGSEDDELEAEIQLMRENPTEDSPPFECLLWVVVGKKSDGNWCTSQMRVRGEELEEEIHDWEQRCLKVFARCAVLLNQAIMPDFDKIFEEEFRSSDRYGMRGGDGGSKSPRIRPEALLDMKQGGGF